MVYRGGAQKQRSTFAPIWGLVSITTEEQQFRGGGDGEGKARETTMRSIRKGGEGGFSRHSRLDSTKLLEFPCRITAYQIITFNTKINKAVEQTSIG